MYTVSETETDGVETVSTKYKVSPKIITTCVIVIMCKQLKYNVTAFALILLSITKQNTNIEMKPEINLI